MLTQKDFYQELTSLQNRFNAMQPELDVTVRDKKNGVEGFVVVWNTAISRDGPLPNCAKGGTRIRPGLSHDEVTMLSRCMALKNAAAGLPLGGCKSGLNADSREIGFERKYRRFVEMCKPLTFENGGPFGGFGFDIGAAPEHAVWACETLNSTRSFTGKPVNLGGTDYDREGIAGLGVAESAQTLLKINQENTKNIRYAVHGLGAMGSAVIRYFSESGAGLTALGDPKYGGSWQFKHTASKSLINALIGQNTSLVKSLIEDEAQKISDDANDVLSTACDILFPCALQHAIHRDNVEKLQARYIVEGANNPTTLESYSHCFDKGIQHVPDFIANSGGIIAAYIELTSQISDEENTKTHGKVIEAKQFTRSTIKKNVENIVDIGSRYNVPLKDAGLFVAMNAVLRHES